MAAPEYDFYREKLVDLYSKYNPLNVARVELLLKKYEGKEEFFYRQVCAKYSHPVEQPPVSMKASTAPATTTAPKGSAPAPATDTRPKAALPPRPPPPPPPPAHGKVGVGGVTNGCAAARSSTNLARIDFLLLGGRTGFFDHADQSTRAGTSSSGGSGSSESRSRSSDFSSSDDERGRTVAGKAKAMAARPLPGKVAAGAAAARVATTPLAKKKKVGDVALADEEAGGGDSDMSDEGLADALAAKLQASSADAASKGQGGDTESAQKGGGEQSAADKAQQTRIGRRRRDGATDTVGEDGKLTAKSKAIARSKSEQALAAKAKGKADGDGDGVGADDADSESATPLFDQWLACLKFLVGWNEAKKQDADEVTSAFKEHLREEGIDRPKVVEKMCATVVPLLLDVRSIDAAVVKNVKANVVKTLKTVQVSILRIVAFELLRESKTRAEKLKRKAEGKKPLKREEGAPYLASATGISSIAKVVQHFRFEKSFSLGLQQLFKSIKQHVQKGASKDDQRDSSNKRKDTSDAGEKSKKRKINTDDAIGKEP